jgi:hypothetical protein
MTAGVHIIGELLRGDAGLTAIVPVERIKAGKLPDNVELPALFLRCISSVETQMLKRKLTTRTRDRIAVTVRAGNYRQQQDVIERVKKICAGLTGDIGGVDNVAILTAGLGPDVTGPADSFEQTRDFRVSYDAL